MVTCMLKKHAVESLKYLSVMYINVISILNSNSECIIGLGKASLGVTAPFGDCLFFDST